MNDTFIPTTDAVALSQCCAACLLASSNLMALMLKPLPQSKLDALQGLLDGGGSVGIETSVDGKGANRIKLIGLEREGARLMLAEITTAACVQ